MKSIIISADDYAQSAAIDAGILSLIKIGRLSATSCLVMSPRWQQSAKAITTEIHDKAAIGLHLDFTQYGAGLKHSLGQLILRSHLRILPVALIESAIHTQLDQFELALGYPPDYIDGHQHVHQLPQIRDALIRIIQRRYASRKLWIRIARPPLSSGFKATVIRMLGSNALIRLCKKAGIAYSKQLLGVYGFKVGLSTYWQQLDSWLKQAKTGDALMCHPATPGGNTDDLDSIYSARGIEYKVFSAENWPELLEKHGLILATTPIELP